MLFKLVYFTPQNFATIITMMNVLSTNSPGNKDRIGSLAVKINGSSEKRFTLCFLGSLNSNF